MRTPAGPSGRSRLAMSTDRIIPRALAARAASGDTGCDDGDLQIVPTGSPAGLVIAGDIDEFIFLTLAALLTRLAEGNGEIHLNLASVRYCDLAGLRALVGLVGAAVTGHNTMAGGSYCTGYPRTSTVLQILGWDSVPGLVI